jgi:hypothetical protein
MSFSPETKRQIVSRDSIGDTTYQFPDMHASHDDHNRKDPHYDEVGNGEIINRPDHYMEHFLEADRLGDMIHGNFHEYAAQKLWDSMTDDEKAYMFYKQNMG